MNYLNGETQERLDRLTADGWDFSGCDETRRCRNGWEGQSKIGTVKAPTLELAVREAWKLQARGEV